MTDQADRERESRETEESGFERGLEAEEAERDTAADRVGPPPAADDDDDD
jgi:hypothetical protein